jgi:hypothetical protein
MSVQNVCLEDKDSLEKKSENYMHYNDASIKLMEQFDNEKKYVNNFLYAVRNRKICQLLNVAVFHPLKSSCLKRALK